MPRGMGGGGGGEEAPSSAVDSHGLPAAATRRLEDPDHSRIH